MKMKKGTRALSLLMVLALAAVMFVSAVGAEEQNGSTQVQDDSQAIFEIIGYTDEFQTQVLSSSKTADLLAEEYGKLNIPSTIERYDIVQFNEVPMRTDQKNSLKVTIYGKEYSMDLERMNFENIDDGIDSYSGSVEGLDDSVAIFTFNKNILYGTIQLQDEIIFIEPVQNREYAMKTAMPLHIIYSSKDMEQVDISMIDKYEEKVPDFIIQTTSNSEDVTKSTKSWESVYVLVVTDNEFYALESDWVSAAQGYMAQAAYQYQRPDIEVFLNVAAYDASNKTTFSSDGRKTTDPFNLLREICPESYLNSKSADIAIYLGGNDKEGPEQGLAYQPGRYAWSQMVDDADTIDLYDGSYHARVWCIIHEIGHNFNAGHQDNGGYNQAYQWWESVVVPKYTVMWSSYFGSSFSTWKYSSLQYDGDSTHDNARALRIQKSTTAGYA